MRPVLSFILLLALCLPLSGISEEVQPRVAPSNSSSTESPRLTPSNPVPPYLNLEYRTNGRPLIDKALLRAMRGPGSQAASRTCGTVADPPCGCDPSGPDGVGGYDLSDITVMIDACELRNGAPYLPGAQLDGYLNPFFGCEPTFGDLFTLLDLEFFSNCPIPSCLLQRPTLLNQDLQVRADIRRTVPVGAAMFVDTVRLINRSFFETYYVTGITLPLEYKPTVPVPPGVDFSYVNLFPGPFGGITELSPYPATEKVVFTHYNPAPGVILPPRGSLDLLEVTHSSFAVLSSQMNGELFICCPADVPVISSSKELLGCPTSTERPVQNTFVIHDNCCVDKPGNVDCSSKEDPDISDVTVLIQHLFITGATLCCFDEGNLDGGGDVDISDLTVLVDLLFITEGLELPACI